MKNESAITTSAYIVLFCVPFWSIPLLPGTYRSPAPFIAAGIAISSLVHVHRARLNFGDRCLVGFAAFALIYALALVLAGEASLSHFMAGTASWALGLLSYGGYKLLLKHLSYELSLNIHIQVARFIITFGLIESILKLTGFGSIFNPLSEVLSGKSSPRLLITTSEPSWAIQVAIYYLPFLLASKSKTLRPLDITLLSCSPIILLSSFSLTGMLVLLAAILIYVFFDGWGSILRRGGILIGAIAIVLSTVIGIVLLSDGGEYYVSRLYKLASLDAGVNLFQSLLLVDGSLMVRLGYPYLALRMLLEHPLGIGIGQFGAELPNYLQYLPAFGGFSEEIPEHIRNLNADTRNFYLKLLAESGVLSSFFFFVFLFHLRAQLKRIDDNQARRALTLVFCVVLAMMMQFSTAYFACYWSFFALIEKISLGHQNQHRGHNVI